jgi:hypothetical protein
LADYNLEEERLRVIEESEIERKRHGAHQLALKRGLASNQHLSIPGQSASPSITSASSPSKSPGPIIQSPSSPRTPFLDVAGTDVESTWTSCPAVDPQTRPDSSSFYVDESDYSSLAPTPNRPLSLKNESCEAAVNTLESNFVPARLPNFGD